MSKGIRYAKLGLLAGAIVTGSAAMAAKPVVTPAKSTFSAAKAAAGTNKNGRGSDNVTRAQRTSLGKDRDRRGNGIGIGGGRPDRPGRPAEHPPHPEHPEHPRSPH